MKRYKGVTETEILDSWNNLRSALLASQDGNDVNEIMNSLFTEEEKFQLGRRISVAGLLGTKMSIEEISVTLRVGKNTVLNVLRKLERYPKGFSLIEKRTNKVEKIYQERKYKKVGGSKLVFKKKVYSGITRKDIKR